MNKFVFIAVALLTFAGCQNRFQMPTVQVPGSQSAHQVTLTWNASTTSDVIGYNVYRAGLTGGPYTFIGTTTGLNYVDQNVAAGAQYFYVATAYDPNGESIYSNEASATVPTP